MGKQATAGSDVAPALVGPGRHIPALDGLRGLAVIAVVLYHLWPETVPGGWLGVGLFFTLSGFLVVGLLVDDLEDGGVDYGRFYRRRVRRLLPAALLTVVVVVAWAVTTDDTIRSSVTRDGFWAVLNLANWNQMADDGGYAAIFDQAARPLGHMWSLAIEEQFYLLAPVLIGLTKRPVAVVGGGLAVAAVAHVVWWGTADAYLATPVRIAEILAGGALAIAIRKRPSLARVGVLWPIAFVVGAAAIGTFGESDAVVTRGLPALMSLAWIALIAACLTPSVLTQGLSNPVVRWVGLRSYAIYLIHWPVIELTDWNGPLVIAVTLLLAEVSYRIVEDPIRRAEMIVRPLAVLLTSSLVASVGLGLASASFDDESFLVEPGFADDLPDWFVEGPSATGVAEASPGGDGEVRLRLTDDELDDDVLDDDVPDADGSVPVDSVMAGGAPVDADVADAVPDTTAPGESGFVGSPAPEESVAASPPARTFPVPVVVVLGDSTATQIAAGLRAHSDVTQSLAVVDRSTSGCSALIDPLVAWRTYRLSYGYVGEFSFDEPCRIGLDATGVPADLALIIDHGSVLADHQRPDGTWASILDVDVQADVATIYRARIAEASVRGMTLALTTAPVIVDPTGLVGEMDDLGRLAVYNDLVRELADESPGTVLLDLGSILDAAAEDGRFTRPDGLHLDLPGAQTFAEQVLVPALLDLAWARTG